MQDEEKKDDGSVWTSYSDLFTTVAVIFLVMFVFALIKASVSKMQSIVEKKEHEKELEGKVSKKNQILTDKKVSTIEQSINSIKEYEDIISNKVQEMNQFAKDLQKNRTVLKDLIQDQRKKEAMLIASNQNYNKVNSELTKEKEKTQMLNDLIIKKIENINELEQNKKELSSALAKLENKNRKDEKNLEENRNLQNSLKEQISQTRNQLEKIEMKKNQLDEKVTSLSSDLEKKDLENKNLNTSLINLTSELGKVTEISNSKSQEIAMVKEEIAIKNSDLIKEQEKLTETLREVERLKVERDEGNKTVANISEKVRDLKKTLLNYENEKAQLKQNIAELKNELQTTKSNFDSTAQKLAAQVKENQDIEAKYLESSKKITQFEKNEQRLSDINSNQEKIISELKSEVSQMKSINQQLNKKNSDFSQKISKLEMNEQNLIDLNSNQEKFIKDLESTVAKINGENISLKNENSSLNSANKDLHGKVAYQNEELSNMNKELGGAQRKIASLNSENKSLNNNNKNLKEKNNDLQKSIANANEEFKKQKNQLNDCDRVLAEKKDLIDSKIKKIADQDKESKKKLKDMRDLSSKLLLKEKRLDACQKELFLEEGKLARLNDSDKKSNNNEILLAKCNKKNSKLVKASKELEDTLNNFANKASKVKSKLRNSIASKLAEEFKKAKLDVKVDRETGNVVLLMNKDFRFKENSYRLEKVAKKTLRKMIPIYAKVLFNNKDIKKNIQGFNIEGHASPSYRGKYINPSSDNGKAFSYNMKLSAQRSSAITSYIFSNAMGDYRYKNSLKKYAKSIGEGFIRPIKKTGRVPSKMDKCGPYDCYASQRVEISFTLKEDNESVKELLKMVKKIN